MEKPPLGVIPRHIWEETRILSLNSAINRRLAVNNPIPTEWIEEYNELIIKKQGE